MDEKKYVVTIARQFGSLGRPIAMRMSEKLGVEFYDRRRLRKSSIFRCQKSMR